MNTRAAFALGLLLNGLAIVATVYAWPNPVRWILSIVGIAMITALGGAIWYYTEHLLKRSEPEALIALGRSKILLLFFLGGVTAIAAQMVLIASSVWFGGIS